MPEKIAEPKKNRRQRLEITVFCARVALEKSRPPAGPGANRIAANRVYSTGGAPSGKNPTLGTRSSFFRKHLLGGRSFPSIAVLIAPEGAAMPAAK
jgi:hypothetical protein